VVFACAYHIGLALHLFLLAMMKHPPSDLSRGIFGSFDTLGSFDLAGLSHQLVRLGQANLNQDSSVLAPVNCMLTEVTAAMTAVTV